MLFTQLYFWGFLLTVLIAVIINAKYTKSILVQNSILLCTSYYFYGAWDYRFLILIIACTLFNYFAALIMPYYRKISLFLSLTSSLGLLAFFKYYNFFISQAVIGLQELGFSPGELTLEIILPVGISFYTFQALTYTIDVYRDKIKPTKNLLVFATYIAFFPQLVAGPIERASNLLPQFEHLWKFNEDKIIQGIRLILIGLFYKVLIADSLAPLVNTIFENASSESGRTLFLGAIYFAFQIYGDFFGYSTIAIGVAMILGFELMTNFRTPYFSCSFQDFWHRWHISLSSFFREYVYIPLGGSRDGTYSTFRNILIVFALSGFWHGANWTFIVWGIYHGFLLIIEQILNKVFALQSWYRTRCIKIVKGIIVFLLVCLGWIFFRVESIGDAFSYISGMFTLTEKHDWGQGVRYVVYAILMDLYIRSDVRMENDRVIPYIPSIISKHIYSILYVILSFYLIWLSLEAFLRGSNTEFIYFQF